MVVNRSENMTTTTNISDEKTFFISLPQLDGTSHILPVSSLQLNNLGLSELSQQDTPQDNQPQVTQTNPFNIDLEENGSLITNIVYKVIKPEDLDLKPASIKYLPRGRPRKKVCLEKTTIIEPEVKKVMKQARTRSGRITKPPKHIEVDFKKIDITDDSELKTAEFEPLKTNDSEVKQEPLLILNQHCKKRNIPPRYRCPTCNKAYLGKAKILNHFEKHPDHGSISPNVTFKNTATWDFLISTAQKFKGSKVTKFCDELTTLIENAKKIAKYLFKPFKEDQESYIIKNELAAIFGIKEGTYGLDESELFKDISLYEYLENTPKRDEQKEEKTNNEIDLLNNHLNNQNSLALVKYEMPKLYNFTTPEFSDDNHEFNRRNVQLTVDKADENKCLDTKKEVFHQLQKEITLHNELHDVDELMLENVDTGQVNILETSSNSDDIMNVDQFVNERFKKLTEPDIDIHGNSLNLELPPLDIFQFHTS
ncbi:uncharacterized protein [Onthophagus taurus]|uniref:uncharacterized protein n=1 Tax=Onthophagus taurus TaxID=166361 RepID=UPI000C1FE7F4|nr:uncharacterized protein LOC111419441 [Onthophagus taurus]